MPYTGAQIKGLKFINKAFYYRFCHRHGKKDTTVSKSPPPELLAMAQIVVPRLCVRLHQQLKELEPYTIGTCT